VLPAAPEDSAAQKEERRNIVCRPAPRRRHVPRGTARSGYSNGRERRGAVNISQRQQPEPRATSLPVASLLATPAHFKPAARRAAVEPRLNAMERHVAVRHVARTHAKRKKVQAGGPKAR